jgi:hypothetical protein
MPKGFGKGAMVGATIGIIVVLVLIVMAASRSSPGGSGENLMWLLTYSTVWGLPTSLAWSPFVAFVPTTDAPSYVIYTLLILMVPLNWALIGGITGWAVHRVRSG